jgi:hypothetical protein
MLSAMYRRRTSRDRALPRLNILRSGEPGIGRKETLSFPKCPYRLWRPLSLQFLTHWVKRAVSEQLNSRALKLSARPPCKVEIYSCTKNTSLTVFYEHFLEKSRNFHRFKSTTNYNGLIWVELRQNRCSVNSQNKNLKFVMISQNKTHRQADRQTD